MQLIIGRRLTDLNSQGEGVVPRRATTRARKCKLSVQPARFYVHDPSAIMFLIDPDLFTIRKGPVRVVTDGIAVGETIMPAYDYQLELPPWRGRPAVTTATDVDVKRFLETFESVMKRK
jgi:inosine-uridine nucleoside N-ribohydrolase